MSLNISPLSSRAGAYLEVCPRGRNRYSCHLSPTESSVVSDDLLQAAALVERGAGGHQQGLLWKSAFDSTRRVSYGWCVRVATEQRTIQVELISPAWRHYSVSINPTWALEGAACPLWVHSTAMVLAEE